MSELSEPTPIFVKREGDCYHAKVGTEEVTFTDNSFLVISRSAGWWIVEVEGKRLIMEDLGVFQMAMRRASRKPRKAKHLRGGRVSAPSSKQNKQE